MKSTLSNMTAVLFGITLVAAAGLGIVNMVTKQPIADAEKLKAEQLAQKVLPEGVQISPADTLFNVKGNMVSVATGRRNDTIVGYAIAVPSLTKNGFNGKISLMVGFNLDGTICNIQVLKQNETPGLGSNMETDGNKLYKSFFTQDGNKLVGKDPGKMKLSVKKDGGEVDALTAATISSKAYVNAIETAYAAFLKKREADFMTKSTSDVAQPSESAKEPVAQEGEKNE